MSSLAIPFRWNRSIIQAFAVLVIMVTMALSLLGWAASFNAFGSDMASYLMTKHWLLGNGLPVQDQGAHFRPPLIGAWFILVDYLGWSIRYEGSRDLEAGKLALLMLTFLPPLGAVVLLRRYVAPIWTALGIVVMLLWPYSGHLVALNGVTLLALPFALWGWAAMIRLAEGEGRIWELTPPAFLLAGSNQTVTGVFVVIALGVLLYARDRWRLLRALLLATLVSVPWLWFYQQNFTWFTGLYIPNISLMVLYPNPITILAFVPFALTALLYPTKGYYLAAPALLLAVLSQFISPDTALGSLLGRAGTFLSASIPVPLVMIIAKGMGFAMAHPSAKASEKVLENVVFCSISILCGVFFLLWGQVFTRDAIRFNFVHNDALAALNWLKVNTPETARVMAHPDALGWYVGGYANRPWIGTSGRGTPQKANAGVDAAFTCTMGWRQSCDPIKLHQTYGVQYIVIDRSSWQTVNDDGQGWEPIERQPWLTREVTFGDVTIYQLEAGP